MDMITVKDLYDTGADLISENDENPEYDRGVAELIADLDPVAGQSHEQTSVNVLMELRKIRDELNRHDAIVNAWIERPV